ncbi:cyclase family protein [Croceivirga thetidis]|uniref:Cyclase family protein n=1 Tax=Croceivirga thetidis TaxID=2721623 RepID=A0ABX1GNR5_9FLAO|nr:cyclase family protein [Croceivirga thetidis]NKI30731.1 cyclase family protein [Croceivirga thetidis]
MIATIKYNSKNLKINLSNPLDISIALTGNKENVNAWYVGPPKISPHVEEGFIGSVKDGAVINFNDIYFNPHSHVTHTECVGHITEEVHSVNENLKQYFFLAELVSVAPEKKDDDFVISARQLKYVLGNKKREAIVIRTLPNTNSKTARQYSHSNPPYLLEEAIVYLRDKGIKHLLVDLPSVDREKDEGKLLGHNAWWNTNGELRMDATITEFVYVANSIDDGTYFLNLQVAPFENDASPSRPVLYKIMS